MTLWGFWAVGLDKKTKTKAIWRLHFGTLGKCDEHFSHFIWHLSRLRNNTWKIIVGCSWQIDFRIEIWQLLHLCFIGTSPAYCRSLSCKTQRTHTHTDTHPHPHTHTHTHTLWSEGASVANKRPYLSCCGVFSPWALALHVGVCLCMSSVVCKYCPSMSEELLCTQPQPTQQTLPSPLSVRLPSIPGTLPLLHLLVFSHHSRLYYRIYLNRTPPRAPFLSPLYEWYKTTWLKGKILWLGVPGYWLNHTHTRTHTHVLIHTRIHSRTPSFC